MTTIDKENEIRQCNDMQTANIKDMIFTIRGQQVMLDSDLAKLYGTEGDVLPPLIALKWGLPAR